MREKRRKFGGKRLGERQSVVLKGYANALSEGELPGSGEETWDKARVNTRIVGGTSRKPRPAYFARKNRKKKAQGFMLRDLPSGSTSV